MAKIAKIVVFEGKKIRRHWDENKEKWYFSITDIVAALSHSVNPLAYWRKLKERLKNEGGDETVTKCHALKMVAADGKFHEKGVDVQIEVDIVRGAIKNEFDKKII